MSYLVEVRSRTCLRDGIRLLLMRLDPGFSANVRGDTDPTFLDPTNECADHRMPNMENTDVEKGSVSDVKDHASTSPSYSTNGGGEPNYEETTIIHQSFGRKLFESFKRDPNRTATPVGVIGSNGRVYDGKGAAKATASSPLARRLKGRHLQMIAIGGSIGKSVLKVRTSDLTIHRYWSFRRIWEGS